MKRRPLTFARWSRVLLWYAGFAVVVLCLAPWAGPTQLPWRQVWAELTGQAPYSEIGEIFLNQRVPRVLLGLLAGGALGLAGAAFQVLLRNPLATPYTLGVASAGALTAAVSMVWPVFGATLGPFSATQGAALAGGTAAGVFIYVVARQTRGLSTHVLLLAGVALNLFCGSALLLVRFLADPYHLVAVDRWLMGGLITVGYSDLLGMLPFLVLGGAMLISQSHALNQLAFGEDVAGSRGVRVTRLLTFTFTGGVLLTTGVVAIAGPIGFVGLIVPHVVRMLSGPDQRIVLPASALLAGAMLALCDAGARTWVAPTEIPVGVITACIGAPVFLVILLRHVARHS
jgi:iron complex transport system permease protein